MLLKRLKRGIAERKAKTEKLIAGVEEKINTLPSGRIRLSRYKDKTYFYHIKDDDHNGDKIEISDQSLVQQLIQKNYLQKVLATAKQEVKAMDAFISRFPEVAVEELYDTFSEERKGYIHPVYPTEEQYAQRWQNTPFDGKPIEEGTYTYTTLKGEMVRSKSEKIIADTLNLNGIPYKYECPLRIGNIVLHPDFTVLKKSEFKEYYWEHCGKTDDPEYAANHIVKRLKLYAEMGITAGKGLYLTFEASKVPLDMKAVDLIVEELR